MQIIKSYIRWLIQDGLLMQTYFGICGTLFLTLGIFCFFGSWEVYSKDHEIAFAVAILIFGLLFIGIGILWLSVCLFHPDSTIAKLGLKVPFDGMDLILLIIIPLFFLFAALITTILKLVGVRGYPIKFYEKIYS
jgi:hypothetical protein